MQKQAKKYIEVCYSPALYDYYRNDDAIVVVSDILRATTAICAAFDNGVKNLIPVGGIDEAREWKAKGYLVAAERDGIVLDFADFGNSPFNFKPDRVRGRTIVYSTTNGTQAIMMASGAKQVAVGAFVNLSALAGWLLEAGRDVVILCAGWKNRFNLEDTVFAGALADKLTGSGNFATKCDAAVAARDLWLTAQADLVGYMEKAAHRHRLKKLGLDDVLEYCFTPDSTDVIPVLKGDMLVSHTDY
ncbi:MAG: 2-phosphosulfolactate phosphatase [Marinilabiliales bacterium]|nr:MAG: 2-phosphosulfolactate phosphatase [Marinilabiliales bacterium]